MADSETPRRAAACRNVSLLSVTLYAPLPRPYPLPLGDLAQALRSHPRTSREKREARRAREHWSGKVLCTTARRSLTIASSPLRRIPGSSSAGKRVTSGRRPTPPYTALGPTRHISGVYGLGCMAKAATLCNISL